VSLVTYDPLSFTSHRTRDSTCALPGSHSPSTNCGAQLTGGREDLLLMGPICPDTAKSPLNSTPCALTRPQSNLTSTSQETLDHLLSFKGKPAGTTSVVLITKLQAARGSPEFKTRRAATPRQQDAGHPSASQSPAKLLVPAAQQLGVLANALHQAPSESPCSLTRARHF